MQERESFLKFPECPDPAFLQDNPTSWETLAAVHGRGRPDNHLQVMLRHMLPNSIRLVVNKFLRDRPGSTTQNIPQYLKSDLTRGDENTADAMTSGRFNDLPGYRTSHVHLRVEEAPGQGPKTSEAEPPSEVVNMPR